MNGRPRHIIRRTLIVLAATGAGLLVLYLAGNPSGPEAAGRTELVVWGMWRGEGCE